MQKLSYLHVPILPQFYVADSLRPVHKQANSDLGDIAAGSYYYEKFSDKHLIVEEIKKNTKFAQDELKIGPANSNMRISRVPRNIHSELIPLLQFDDGSK